MIASLSIWTSSSNQSQTCYVITLLVVFLTFAWTIPQYLDWGVAVLRGGFSGSLPYWPLCHQCTPLPFWLLSCPLLQLVWGICGWSRPHALVTIMYSFGNNLSQRWLQNLVGNMTKCGILFNYRSPLSSPFSTACTGSSSLLLNDLECNGYLCCDRSSLLVL